jgi:hypothetical protein
VKKLLVVLLSILVLPLFITSCIVDTGPVTTRTFDYTDYKAVEISSAFQAEIVQSNDWSISITAGSKLVDHLDVRVEEGILKIGLRNWQSWNIRRPTARITMPELYSMKLSGASKVSIMGFQSQHDTDFNVSGASKLDLDLDAYDVRTEISGASRITGCINVHDFDMEVSGASRVELNGSGNLLDVYVSGASNVNLENFPTTEASVNVSGASRLTVSSTDKLSVSLSGASSLYYTGNPELNSIDVSGSSKIHKK